MPLRAESDDQMMANLLEAARRAHWDATRGPSFLQNGKFRPWRGTNVEAVLDAMTPEQKLECLQEAARRANWDALHGPDYLRTGEFCPWINNPFITYHDLFPDTRPQKYS